MSAPGRSAILPVKLGLLPPERELSKTYAITQRWNDPNLVNGVATYNLLQEYQSGQFTTIQAIWIDNSTNSLAVRFTCLETGFTINVGPFTQGMYPLASNVAPIFTLSQPATVANSASTKFIVFNTPQRYFVQSNVTVFDGGAVNVDAPFNGAGIDTNFITNSNPATIFFRMKAFQLSIRMITGGPWGGNQSVTLQLKDNASVVWADTFNVTAASFGTLFDKAFQFPTPTNPTLNNDIWSLNVSAVPPGGLQFDMNYYFDTVNIM